MLQYAAMAAPSDDPMTTHGWYSRYPWYKRPLWPPSENTLQYKNHREVMESPRDDLVARRILFPLQGRSLSPEHTPWINKLSFPPRYSPTSALKTNSLSSLPKPNIRSPPVSKPLIASKPISQPSQQLENHQSPSPVSKPLIASKPISQP